MSNLLIYNAEYNICTICRYALRDGTSAIVEHLSALRNDLFAGHKELRAYAKSFVMYEQQPAQVIQMLYMSPDAPPVAHLELHSDGLACKLCQGLSKILCSPGSMRNHLKGMHGWNKNRPKGRQRYSKRHEYSSLDEVTRPVYCQTFYKAGGLCRFFEVYNPDSFDTAASHPRPHPEPELSLRQIVEQDLTKKAQAIRDKAPIVAFPH